MLDINTLERDVNTGKNTCERHISLSVPDMPTVGHNRLLYPGQSFSLHIQQHFRCHIGTGIGYAMSYILHSCRFSLKYLFFEKALEEEVHWKGVWWSWRSLYSTTIANDPSAERVGQELLYFCRMLSRSIDMLERQVIQKSGKTFCSSFK